MIVKDFLRDCPKNKPIAVTFFDSSNGTPETVSVLIRNGKLPDDIYERFKDREIDSTNASLIPHVVILV